MRSSSIELLKIAKSLIGREQVLDVAKIKGFRKDFLLMMKNVNIIQDYDMANEWRDVVQKWSNDFEEYIFKFLIQDLQNLKHKEVIDKKWADYWDDRLRKDLWNISMTLRVPLDFSDDYYSKEQRYAELQEKLPKWERKVRRVARVAWKTLSEFVKWFEDKTGNQMSVDVPVEEDVKIQGFSVRVSGADTGYESGKAMSVLVSALKKYRQRASGVFPEMLKRQLPLFVDFKCNLDKAGSYRGRDILICGHAMLSGVNETVHVLAHEMGHEIYRSLPSKASKFWDGVLSGSDVKLDLNDVLSKYGSVRSFFRSNTIKKSDPLLYLQIDSLISNPYYKHTFGDILSMDQLREYLENGGNPEVVVNTRQITGYSGKNAEEAFCEGLGMLVAYGSRTLHPEVVRWLKIALPGLKA